MNKKELEMNIETVESFTKLADIESLCLKNHFGNVSICGSCIAKNEKGRLRYVANNDPEAELKKKLVEDTRSALKDYYFIAKALFSMERPLSAVENAKLKKGLQKVKSYCLDHGFYGKALDFAKLLKEHYRTDELSTVERAIKGYAERQILTGDDQTRNFHNVIRRIMFNRYGSEMREIGKTHFLDLFKNTTVVIKRKKFGLKDYEKAIANAIKGE